MSALIGGASRAKPLRFIFTSPSIPAGVVWPAPVTSNITDEPAAAGLALLLNEPSWFQAAICPVPEPSTVKMPGADGATGTFTGVDGVSECST